MKLQMLLILSMLSMLSTGLLRAEAVDKNAVNAADLADANCQGNPRADCGVDPSAVATAKAAVKAAKANCQGNPRADCSEDPTLAAAKAALAAAKAANTAGKEDGKNKHNKGHKHKKK